MEDLFGEPGKDSSPFPGLQVHITEAEMERLPEPVFTEDDLPNPTLSQEDYEEIEDLDELVQRFQENNVDVNTHSEAVDRARKERYALLRQPTNDFEPPSEEISLNGTKVLVSGLSHPPVAHSKEKIDFNPDKQTGYSPEVKAYLEGVAEDLSKSSDTVLIESTFNSPQIEFPPRELEIAVSMNSHERAVREYGEEWISSSHLEQLKEREESSDKVSKMMEELSELGKMATQDIEAIHHAYSAQEALTLPGGLKKQWLRENYPNSFIADSIREFYMAEEVIEHVRDSNQIQVLVGGNHVEGIAYYLEESST